VYNVMRVYGKNFLILVMLGVQCVSYTSVQEWYDTTFGSDHTGIVTTTVGINTAIHDILLQADEKIVAAGQVGSSMLLLRYTTDGILDISFNGTGFVAESLGSRAYATSLALQTTNIIVAGSARIGGTNPVTLARYTDAGILDATFGVDGIVTQTVGTNGDVAHSVVVDSTSNIIVGGTAVSNGKAEGFLARFDENGTLDILFGNDGIARISSGHHTLINRIMLDANEHIVGVGNTTVPGGSDFLLFRCTPDGALDPNFGVDGIVTVHIGDFNECMALVLDAMGNSIIAGHARTNASSQRNLVVARYDSNGVIDTNFGNDGLVTIPVERGTLHDVALDAGGKIVVTGTVDTAFFTARINTDGSIDTDFGVDGFLSTEIGNNANARALAIQQDTKIVTAGLSDLSAALVRYKSSLSDSVLISNPSENGIFTRPIIKINGTSSFTNETIDVFIDDLITPVTSVESDGSGNWDAGDSPLLSDGSHVVYAQQQGNADSRDAKAFIINTAQAPHASLLVFSGNGLLPTGTTYMRPGTGIPSESEITIRIPAAIIVRSIAVQALIPPGIGLSDTWTVRRNGVDTALAITLNDLQTEGVNNADPVVFNAGDVLSVKLEGDLLALTTDATVVLEIQ
jgi:uncharacterized delta-60 repeat protein